MGGWDLTVSHASLGFLPLCHSLVQILRVSAVCTRFLFVDVVLGARVSLMSKLLWEWWAGEILNEGTRNGRIVEEAVRAAGDGRSFRSSQRFLSFYFTRSSFVSEIQ